MAGMESRTTGVGGGERDGIPSYWVWGIDLGSGRG